MIAADEAIPVGFVPGNGLAAFDHQHMAHEDGSLLTGARAAREDLQVELRHELTFDKQFIEGRVARIGSLGSENHLAIRSQAQFAGAVAVIMQMYPANLYRILRSYGNFHG